MDSRKLRTTSGITIVELLVVIVIIGILAAITIVVYTGISQKAIASSLQSDLTNAATKLKIFQVDNDAFPTGLDCSATPAINTICLKSSPGTTYTYFPVNNTNPKTFSLTASSGSTTYRIASNSTPTSCPDNFIAVPGSATYGTSSFCVMKYVAKQVGATTTPISQASGTPWVSSISQTTAIANSPNVSGCTGCHLITEAEWMTIAQNVLNNPSNWSGGTVGSGYIYSGHNDNAPANSLDASIDDNDGYYGTGNVSPSNQKRTLTLSNGEVIWDLSGNVWQWTAGTSTTGQPGVTGAGGAYREWTAVTNPGTISPNPSASATGITGASGWNSGNGIGVIYSNTEETGLRGFIRGGVWTGGAAAGVVALILDSAPSYNTSLGIGFRVSR